MKCKNCGAQIDNGVQICPICKQKVQKLSTGAVVVISMAAVLVIAVVLAAILLLGKDRTGSDPGEVSNPGDTTASGQQTTGDAPGTDDPGETVSHPEGSYTVDPADVSEAKMQQVVATNGDAELTNELLSYYYWFGYSSFVNYYGEYITQFLDVSQPHDTQYYDDGETTWQTYFLDMALQNFRYYTAMCAEATARGFQLDSQYESYLNDMETSLESNAGQYGYATAEDYLQACFGAKSTVAGYREFMRQYLVCMSYVSYLQQSFSFTEDEVSQYYEQNRADYEAAEILQDGTRLVSVRHILISPTDTDSEDDWAEAEQNAKDIYQTWQNNPTEDYFAQLANTYSTDTGSNTTGGRYDNVYPGQMTAEFNDWCFDMEHETGDTAIVKTGFGYHIMYFCDYGTEFWKYAAGSDLLNQTYAEAEQAIVERNELVTDYEKIILLDPTGMFSGS